jgi:uncharacterized protein (TIGR02186 family)
MVRLRRPLAAVLLALLAAVWTASGARSDTLVGGLDPDSVSLGATFDGSEILIYGAIRRSTPEAEGEAPLGVIVTLQGPNSPVTVWRKGRRGGIWVNVEGVRVNRAPSFYAVAASAMLSEVLTEAEDLRYRVSIARAVRVIGPPGAAADPPTFMEALIRIRRAQGIYQHHDSGIRIEGGALFTTRITLPSALTEGSYIVRFLLVRDGQVLHMQTREIEVRKVGLERFLYRLAQDQPFLYGLLALFLAVFAGWGASAAFARLRR